jgi:hypothetical protein
MHHWSAEIDQLLVAATELEHSMLAGVSAIQPAEAAREFISAKRTSYEQAELFWVARIISGSHRVSFQLSAQGWRRNSNAIGTLRRG